MMSSEEPDIPESDESLRTHTKPQQSRVAVIGLIFLIAGGLCTVSSLVFGFTTYSNSRAQNIAIAMSIAIGLAAFLFLGCAWRFLTRNGKIRAVVIGGLNLIQLTITIMPD